MRSTQMLVKIYNTCSLFATSNRIINDLEINIAKNYSSAILCNDIIAWYTLFWIWTSHDRVVLHFVVLDPSTKFRAPNLDHWIVYNQRAEFCKLKITCYFAKLINYFFFALFLTPGAGLPVLGPRLWCLCSNTWNDALLVRYNTRLWT